jgi:hypothetical protein
MQHNDSPTPIRIHYALYDSDTANSKTISGVPYTVFWTWWSDELAGSPLHIYQMCNELYGKLPQNGGKVWGGFLRYENYTVLYRFFDAGSYKDGRPEHYVILTAWIKTAETLGKDLSDIFNDEVFQFVDKATKDHDYPVPKPPRLSLKVVGKPADGVDSLVSQFSWHGEYIYTGSDALKRASATWAADNGGRVLSVQIESSENEQCAMLKLKSLPPPKTPMSPREPSEEKPYNLLGWRTVLGIVGGLFAMLVLGLLVALVVMKVQNPPLKKGEESGKPPTDSYEIPPTTNGEGVWLPPSPLPSPKPSIDEVKRLFEQLHITEQSKMFTLLPRDQKRGLLEDLEPDDLVAVFGRLNSTRRRSFILDYFTQLNSDDQKLLLDDLQKIHNPRQSPQR